MGSRAGVRDCHYPPWPRRCFAWAVYDFNESARMAIRFLWERHLEDHGLPVTACPVAGLFPAAPEPPHSAPIIGGASSGSGLSAEARAAVAKAAPRRRNASAPAEPSQAPDKKAKRG